MYINKGRFLHYANAFLFNYDPLRRVASATSGCAGFGSISCKGVTPPSHRDRTIPNREHGVSQEMEISLV